MGGDLFMDMWKRNKATLTSYPGFRLEAPPFIFADPTSEEGTKIKMRQPKLRPDEIDPCDEVVA